jgi:hypothetical protein
VQHGTLKLVHCRKKKPLSSRLGLSVDGVGDGTKENSLRAGTRHSDLVISLLHTDPQLGVAAEGRDAGEVVVDVETGQLQEVGEGGAHVAAKGSLRVVVALEEGEVPGDLGWLLTKRVSEHL